MEFWGVEVKAGQALKVNPEAGKVIHISQAALGEGKKEKGNVLIPLHVKINDNKYIVGSLTGEKFPQVSFDLLFEKEFELSHDWKNGSVYFCGYSAENPISDEEDDSDSQGSDDDEDVSLGITENGDIASKAEVAKAAATKGKGAKPESSAKPKVTGVEPKKEEFDDDDDDSDDGDEDSDDVDSDDDETMDGVGVSEDEDDSEDESEGEDDSEDEDEKKFKKAGPSKKRPTESAIKTPVAAKKQKLDTPQKTDGKKVGGHAATPHPSKQAVKTSANSNKSKEKSPKSGGSVPCKSCTRTFVSDSALQSHSKAKHGSN